MKTRVKIIFFASLILCVISGLTYGYIYSMLLSDKASVTSLFNQISKDQKSLNNLKEVEVDFAQTLNKSDSLEKLLVKRGEVVDFIQSLESIMAETKVEGAVDSVTEVNEGSDKLSLTLNMRGDWNSVMKMYGLLERLPYKSVINSSSLSFGATPIKKQATKTPAVTKDEWQLSVMMDVYVFSDGQVKEEQKPEPKKQDEE